LGGHSGQIAAQQLRIEHDEFLSFWAKSTGGTNPTSLTSRGRRFRGNVV
jgi:hypothetical protein